VAGDTTPHLLMVYITAADACFVPLARHVMLAQLFALCSRYQGWDSAALQCSTLPITQSVESWDSWVASRRKLLSSLEL
jgi:hypothetical protein